jgi:hypothetical protein
MSATSWTPALQAKDSAPAATPAPKRGDPPLRVAAAALVSIIAWSILARATVEVVRALAAQ